MVEKSCKNSRCTPYFRNALERKVAALNSYSVDTIEKH
jgi:hypothetical protein